MTTSKPLTLNRTAHNSQNHRFTAIGPLADAPHTGRFGVWDHENGEWAHPDGSGATFEYACDAIDLMRELTGE